MNPIRHSHLIRRIAGSLAGVTALLPSITTGPAALAAQLRADPPAWLDRLPLGVYYPPAPAGWDKHPPRPGPAHVHAALAGGMAGWQITLIAGGVMVLAAALAVIARTMHAGRRRATAITAGSHDHIGLGPGRLPRGSEAASPGPAREEVTVNRIRRVRRTLARWTSPPDTGEPYSRHSNGKEPHLARRPGSDDLAARLTRQVAAGARVAAGHNRPAPATTNSRRRTITTSRLLPYTIQLCVHCRQNPAGFWVSRNGDQTVRRPWCLSCCQDLDPARYHIGPFDLQYLR
jgi:hypothetical protein